MRKLESIFAPAESLKGIPGWIGKVMKETNWNANPDPIGRALRFVGEEAVRLTESGRGSYLEATSTGAQGALLRGETQRYADAWYRENQASFSHTKIPMHSNSNKDTEIINPLHSAEVSDYTPELVPANRGQVLGVNVPVTNRKFMKLEEFSRELWDDDRTGQIRQRQQKLAEGAARTIEVYLALRFRGTAGSFGSLVVPASNWTNLATSVNHLGNAVAGIFTATGASGLGNRIAALGALSTSRIKEAHQLMEQMRDRLGNRMGLVPDTLFISPFDHFHAATILNSAFYPSVQGAAGATFNTATSAFPGTPGATNPWQGLYNAVENRYLADWGCYLGIAGQGIVLQMRDPIEIQQELPNSGLSFEIDAIRLRARARWEIEWVEPRMWIQIDDGSVAGSF
jgi:hypothetical protein